MSELLCSFDQKGGKSETSPEQGVYNETIEKETTWEERDFTYHDLYKKVLLLHNARTFPQEFRETFLSDTCSHVVNSREISLSRSLPSYRPLFLSSFLSPTLSLFISETQFFKPHSLEYGVFALVT